MDAKITSSKENPVMARKEVVVSISFDKSTPSRKEIKELVVGKTGANPDAMVIREVISRFGIRSVNAVLHIYQTKEAALSTEPRHILVREGMAEKKPKKEKKKTAPAAKKK